MLTKETLQAAIVESTSVTEVAKRFKASNQVIYARIRSWGLSLDDLRDPEVGPTPEEIAERAAEVRESWTPSEHRRRAVGGAPRRWRPPAYREGELIGVAESLSISRR
ncbi:hypothetical protein EBZ80_24290 [bacterium]|nr:hypothetical protein [bacterium]